jgi:23S rRNA (guanine745-N1)-methyltransferase
MTQFIPSPYLCPICQDSLNLTENKKSYCCAKNHHFDVAKEGYLNLLPAQHKKSKEPGDSKAMMQARRNFLEADFYQCRF